MLNSNDELELGSKLDDGTYIGCNNTNWVVNALRTTQSTIRQRGVVWLIRLVERASYLED